MNITVEKQIDSETKEIWGFKLFDFNLVFTGWSLQKKPKGKRKWIIEKFWDKYHHRREFKMVEEPVLPDIIRSEALSEVFKHIRVKTWKEWKG